MPPRPKPALPALLLAAGLVAGCGQSGESRPSEPSPASGPSAPAASSAAPALAPPALLDPNPFNLPSRTLALDSGRRVFTVSEQTLAGAKLGSTIVMQAATVAGFDGELLVIEGQNGPYKVHPAYAIAVPDKAAIRPAIPVVTERNGLLRHAVVKKHVRDRVTVRFTDEGLRHGELVLKNTRFIPQKDGLHPGNYAALGEEETLRHVLLVSPFDDGEKKWLVLGAAGAAMIARESALEPIPVKYQPRAGTAVLAEHNGVLRKGTIQSASEPGIFSVKYERAGRPAALGWGFVMPVGPDRGGARRPAGAPAR